MGLWNDFQAWVSPTAPTPPQEVSAPKQAAPKEKLDFFHRLSIAESGGDFNAQSKTSTAAGGYQFTLGTWRGALKQHGFNYTDDDRKDTVKSKEIAELHDRWNTDYLKKSLGYEPTDAQRYAAWFLGAYGATRLLMASPKKPAIDVVKPNQVKANENIFYVGKYENKKFIKERPRTVSEVYQILSEKIGE